VQEFTIEQRSNPGKPVMYMISPTPTTRLHQEIRAGFWKWSEPKTRWWVYLEFNNRVELAFGPFKDHSWASANERMLLELINMKWIQA
jgi:hypothetical protein